MLHRLLERRTHRVALASLFVTLLLAATGCGGGRDGVAEPLAVAVEPTPVEGATSKVVAVGNEPGAALALFADGRAFFSPDGLNLGGGGATLAASDGPLQVADIVPVGGGVVALLSDGSAFYSPDGLNLAGGGRSERAYQGAVAIASLTAVGTGVNATLANGGAVYWSPDGRNLGGGGATVQAYEGGRVIRQIVAVGPGDAVVTLFDDGTATWSPDNRSLGGGGDTVAAAGPGAEITRLVRVGGGVLAQLESGAVRLSPDGLDLDTGLDVAGWQALANAPFPPRDSAQGASFGGRLWVSGGFTIPSLSFNCIATCGYFDLWSSVDPNGLAWNTAPSFATHGPDPRDVATSQDDPVLSFASPSDFYDAYGALVVWNGQLTAIGATVWRSLDGLSWQVNDIGDGVTPSPGPLPVRATENTRAVVLGNALFLVQPDTGAVYRSTDARGALWTPLGVIAGFAPRCGAVVFALHGRIWIEGGGACDYSQAYNEIWSSVDGLNWTRQAAPAAWSPRMWACVAMSPDGIVWLATGYAPTDWNGTATNKIVRYSLNHSDVWYSRDGLGWKQLKADARAGLADDGIFEPRHAPTCFVTGTAASGLSLLVVAGSGSPDGNGANGRVLNSIRSLPVPTADLLP
jgi:hypothetical protein